MIKEKIVKDISISPILILILVSISIFSSHIIVMLTTGDSHYPMAVTELIIDSIIMTGLLFPLLYFLVSKPLIKQISAREKTHLQLLANERKFRDLVDNMNEGLVVQNTEGIITFVNKCFADIINIPKEELVGFELNELLDKDNLLILQNHLTNLEQFGTDKVEITWRANKRRNVYTIISPSLIFDENNSVIGRFFVVADITQRKEMELELLKATELVKHSDKVKSDFLHLISHEIRTPVNIVLGFTNLIQEEFNPTADIEEYITTIKIGLNRLIRTIDLILNSALEISGVTKFDFKQIDIVHEILQPVLLELSPVAQQKDILISTIYKQFPQIVVDQYSIRQILIHLIENAIKFTNTGGKIEIQVEESANNTILVSISDNGIGISQEYLPKLFNLFSQEDESSTRKYDGNGLGLFLVKKYCEKNIIDLTVESEKEKGSTFTLSFQQK